MMFDGKIAVVTGASRGIGRAIAVDFAHYGAEIVLIGRDREALEGTAAACRAARAAVKCLIITGDAADPAAVESFVAKTLDAFGRLDFAVANAGQSRDGLIVRL